MSRRPANVASSRSPWSSRRLWLIWLLLGVYVALRFYWFLTLRAPTDLLPGDYHVARVVDGDTFVLDDGSRVRLMGVNCPESVKPNAPVEPFGIEASEFVRRQVEAAAGMVRLEFDRERVDNYGRLLAFVWIGEQLLNEELLRAGLARWEPYFSYSASMKTRFRRAEEEARRERRGVWSDEK